MPFLQVMGHSTQTNFMSSTLQLKETLDRGENTVILDVRTPVEFRSVHINSAKNIPLGELSGEQSLDGIVDKTDQFFLICQSGGRSRKALEILQSAGYSKAESVEGGMNAWTEQGYPTVKGKRAISIERQVRIVAGGLVVLGAVLSYTVHDAFIGLSAFVGAGLVFAGVTDTCGMGLLLARMPWNR